MPTQRHVSPGLGTKCYSHCLDHFQDVLPGLCVQLRETGGVSLGPTIAVRCGRGERAKMGDVRGEWVVETTCLCRWMPKFLE